MNDLEKNLAQNAKEFLHSAGEIYNKGDYTSSAVLYFKALFAILDPIVLREKGFVPKDHGERFRILESNFSELYEFVDKNFTIYQNSYNSRINKEDCNNIKEYAETLTQKQR